MVTEPSNLKASAIQEYACQVGDAYHVYDEQGCADLDLLLQKLGGTTEYASDSESLHVRNVGDFTVYLPQFTSNRRDRFTKAHELGHYFLHYLYPKLTGECSFARGDRNRAETEANIFASALLMPAEPFQRAHKAYNGDAWHLALHFDVSPAAAAVRAEVLGL
ncbi:ImmA/IrrE family metallo-endopeptidase [Arthrobacter sp. efr-133-R2A-120]|uniref:ImmA/IrrE family metallo-endopeptidase n=1 Tax=Arthrobacter sp. efr-133-R2A-120 TaxID=3040277 RepID=UPI00254D0416|nr:ImmA/IrrE family metallo-endopeptidase [Arthrobacter sp. efr-133-R2A-120]